MPEEEKKRRLQIGLNNDVLMTNCGVPIVFVINKIDDPYQKYDKPEFILKHVRKTAINYGATVVYTSTTKNCNISVLYDYIFHSLFNFDLVHKSNIIDKNAFFIPSGYDRLSVLKNSDTDQELDYEFTDIIKKEKEENIVEDEIVCEKVSDFLKKVKDRTYKSRKSIIRDDLRIGKSLLHDKKKDLAKKDEVKDKEKKEENTQAQAEKVNKFQKFMEKKDSKPIEAGGDKTKMSKEERQRITRENLLNKLKLGKKDKK